MLALGTAVVPATAVHAHDDPVVTVRVLCDGFNVLDMDAVLGEISDTATLNVDRPVHGAAAIEAWVREQMDHDLRIEIVDMGVPVRLSDGYTLSWTARLSRQDWRQAGVGARQANNKVTIHNGRITEWSASLTAETVSSAGTPPGAYDPPVVAGGASGSPIPEVFGIPVTLFAAAAIAFVGGSLMLRQVRR